MASVLLANITSRLGGNMSETDKIIKDITDIYKDEKVCFNAYTSYKGYMELNNFDSIEEAIEFGNKMKLVAEKLEFKKNRFAVMEYCDDEESYFFVTRYENEYIYDESECFNLQKRL